MTGIQGWRNLAACRERVTAEDDPFFAGTESGERRALAICSVCPVQTECLAFAVRTGQKYGVWGGRGEQEVRRLVGLERRGRSRAGGATWHRNALKTQCKRGHPFDQANTYYAPGGQRRCRTCLRQAHLAWAQGGERRA